jgi:hypothetical protein
MSFQITDCPWWRRCPKESLMAESCLWDTSVNSDSSLPDCQGNHGICMKTPTGNCGWSTDKKYRECMKNRRRIRDEKLRKEHRMTQRNSSLVIFWGHWCWLFCYISKRVQLNMWNIWGNACSQDSWRLNVRVSYFLFLACARNFTHLCAHCVLKTKNLLVKFGEVDIVKCKKLSFVSRWVESYRPHFAHLSPLWIELQFWRDVQYKTNPWVSTGEWRLMSLWIKFYHRGQTACCNKVKCLLCRFIIRSDNTSESVHCRIYSWQIC